MHYFLKLALVSILTLLTMSFVPVYAHEAEADSLSMSATLQEVVVSAPQTLHVGNRSIYYPTKELKESMATSSQLLAGLQIPELIVNPATGSVSISGGGNLSIRINGRPASEADLMSLSAKVIAKVDYISNPGTRYGDAAGVIDIHVRRRNDGYGVVLNLLQSPNRGWGDYTAALRYSIGRSEWRADYHSNPMWRMDCYRNNIEAINIPGAATVIRQEDGIAAPNRMVTHRASLQYSYANKSSLLFNAQARLIRQNDRYVSTGAITTDSAGIITKGIEKEAAPFSSWQGDMDLYLHWKINSRNKIYMNIVPTFIRSTSDRIYEADNLSLSSAIKTRAFKVLVEGVWEGRVGHGMMTGGFRGDMTESRADYITSATVWHDNSSRTGFFAEWSQWFARFRYSVGVEGTLFRLTEPIARSFTRIMPRMSVAFTASSWGGINLYLDATSTNPTSAQLNPVEQRIDRVQYSIGSLSLTPYMTYRTKLEFDFSFKDTSGKLTVADNYSRRPFMGVKTCCAAFVRQSYCNAGFHNDFIVKGQVRTPLFIKQLTLSLEGGWHKMTSEGLNYRHDYSQPFVNAQVMYITGPWWFMVKYNNAYNMLWGEVISSVNNNLLNIGAGYRYRSAVLMAGIVNPVGKVSLKSRDLSSLAGYERTYHASSTNWLVWVGVSLNISQGRRRAATQKKLDNSSIYETIKNIQK